ncbi:hypothetical protein VFPFJ_08686 [Purpureocillium lilacinum]|uniref:Ubiquitin-like domain-containing protein n=1 Tax=Purpureocillium lilacinum TaxID=33203 RepID=A0A179H039_PURLI|nr:hypothetical protein VFPFJ_08686 [Purpureocillium lilacinum]OAQ74773.1 hypothetical protein VFPBJ_10068 [Purpureocillium lilacinum]OAQ82883.1 hypothetical protein VFPFJ_08686 [Purpureocillium lilacinum]GJN70802.1 hypothetical protein PLICBS_004860 [Purpureocillium lilacinum]GJN79093.1 hypothetical protein PLIIFM63780_002606 [Purpureocillium lilacinum]
MSLGFSVGDFVAVAKLIKEISGCIRHGTTASYQALDLELHTLKRALDEIERLQCPPGQASAVNQVKVAALNCRQPLDQFASKLQAYGILGLQPQTKPDLKSSLGRLAKKVQWGVEMEEHAVRLRATIVAHVGFLALRLNLIGLNADFALSQKLDDHQSALRSQLDQIRGQVIASERKQAAQGSLIKATTGLILEQVSELASACIGVRLDTLVDLAKNIWRSNLRIIAMVSEMHGRLPQPNASHTWFQDPIRFEDALGRVFPIPSEYSWSKVHAIIQDQFATGPGSQKVKSREYLLYNSLDMRRPLPQQHAHLPPGMAMTMTFILGTYGPRAPETCPRIECMSLQSVDDGLGTRFW